MFSCPRKPFGPNINLLRRIHTTHTTPHYSKTTGGFVTTQSIHSLPRYLYSPLGTALAHLRAARASLAGNLDHTTHHRYASSDHRLFRSPLLPFTTSSVYHLFRPLTLLSAIPSDYHPICPLSRHPPPRLSAVHLSLSRKCNVHTTQA